jgi:hypothetical protein
MAEAVRSSLKAQADAAFEAIPAGAWTPAHEAYFVAHLSVLNHDMGVVVKNAVERALARPSDTRRLVVTEAIVEAVRRAVAEEFGRNFPKQSEHEEDCDESVCRCDKDIQGIVQIHNASRRNFTARLASVITAAINAGAGQ